MDREKHLSVLTSSTPFVCYIFYILHLSHNTVNICSVDHGEEIMLPVVIIQDINNNIDWYYQGSNLITMSDNIKGSVIMVGTFNYDFPVISFVFSKLYSIKQKTIPKSCKIRSSLTEVITQHAYVNPKA